MTKTIVYDGEIVMPEQVKHEGGNVQIIGQGQAVPAQAFAGFGHAGAMVNYEDSNGVKYAAAQEALQAKRFEQARNANLAALIGPVIDTKPTFRKWLLGTTALQSV